MDKASLSPLKLLLVEAHSIVKDGLMALLSTEPDMKVVGSAQDGWAAIETARRLIPDVIIMDLLLPGMNGIDTIVEITSRKIASKILVLTADESDGCVRESLRAGASGYILKNCNLPELVLAIRSVSIGNAYLSPAISSSIVNGYVNTTSACDTGSRWHNLTPRERQILQLVAERFHNKEIADKLHISIKTVEKHRSNLRTKLNIHNTLDLIDYWEAHGLSPASYAKEKRKARLGESSSATVSPVIRDHDLRYALLDS